MKNEKPNAELVWKQLDDLIVPRLRLSLGLCESPAALRQAPTFAA
jgi:hypothetical protein